VRFPLNNALKPHFFFRACGALLFSTMISNSTNPRFTTLHKTCNPRFRTPYFDDLQRCISTIYNFHDQLRKIHDLPLFTKNRRFTFQLSTICLLTMNRRFDRRFVRGGLFTANSMVIRGSKIDFALTSRSPGRCNKGLDENR